MKQNRPNKPTNPIYYSTNKAETMVEAKMENVGQEIFNALTKTINQGLNGSHDCVKDTFVFNFFVGKVMDEFNVPDVLSARAWLNKEAGDTFDLEKGMDIARARLLKKVAKIQIRIYDEIAEDFQKLVYAFDKKFDSCVQRYGSFEQTIEDLTKE